MNRIEIGFSPCPNDCFIFDAMMHGKVDTEGLEYEAVMADVEELNRRAFAGSIAVTKLSYHAFAHLTGKYVLLNAGSALGFGVGPLVISKKEYARDEVEKLRIAIPGKYTTANFLFSIAFPSAKNKTEMIFSEIENAVLENKVDAGVIIHENRFTYEQRGLKKIIDLGEWWESETASAIPLGGIVAQRTLPNDIRQKVDRSIRRSVEFAFANPGSSRGFVKAHAQEMDEAVMQKHIDLYVNKYSVDLGVEGRKAVRTLFDKAKETGFIKDMRDDIFSG